MSRKASSSAEIQQIRSAYVLPQFDTARIEEGMQVQSDSLSVRDREGPLTVYFDHIFKSQHDFAKSAYNSLIAPLMRPVIFGESAVALFGGPHASQVGQFLLSQTVMQGLLPQAAAQLLHAVNAGEEKEGSVTFSWLNVDAQGEQLTDVLRVASLLAQGQGQGQGQGGKGGQTGGDSALMLREVGKGQGMAVPGLWEVEIASGGDVEAVLSHVLRSLGERAGEKGERGATSMGLGGLAHSVLTLTVKKKRSAASAPPATPGAPLADQGGRLIFLLLSQFSPSDPPPPSLAPPSASKPSRSAPPVPALSSSSAPFPWLSSLQAVLTHLQTRQQSPPFHKSRLSLLLKDALGGKMSISSLLLLSPPLSPQALSLNASWLRLFSSLPSAEGKGGEGGSLPPKSRGRAMSTGRLAQRPPNNSSRTSLTSSDPLSSAPSAPATPSRPPLFTPNPAPRIFPQENGGEEGLPPSLLDVSPIPRTPLPPPSSTALPPAPSLSSSLPPATPLPPSPPLSSSYNYPADPLSQEALASLSLALEASRSESQALRISYHHIHAQYSELAQRYNSVLEKLSEEGGLLLKRDQERYRALQQDLKDYEIYRQVVDAAMLKMTSEINSLVQENKQLVEQKKSEEKARLLRKKQEEKYVKDLSVVKRKLQESEERVKELEGKTRVLQRERDMAVQTLSQTQSKVQLSFEQTHSKLKDMDEVARKMKALEEKLKLLEQEREGLLQQHDKEVTSLRTAHSKALETLMSYQEENDMLRATVSELTAQQQRKRANSSFSMNPSEII